MEQSVYWAFLGTGFTFFMTVLGAGVVVFSKNEMNRGFQNVFLGFASGVMLAAMIWSLLLPAIERTEEMGDIAWIPAAGGFLLGGTFLMIIDCVLRRFYIKETRDDMDKSFWHKTTLLIMAVTLHNIPEGMAVGLAFAIAVQQPGNPSLFAGAVALAIGMGIQNFPEGAAVSLPLKQIGMSRKKSFVMGSLSGLVELIFGVGITLLAAWIVPFMPWFLSFAAGAMLYVVVKELIPEATGTGKPEIGVFGIMIGFMVMMILDVALG